MERFSWSPEFQRVRAEAFFTSLILMAITQLTLNLNKVPLIGIDINSPAPRGAVALFVWGFVLYSLASWLAKFDVERFKKRRESEIYVSYVAQVGEQVQLLTSFRAPDASGLQGWLKTIKEHAAAIDESIASLPAALSRLDDLPKAQADIAALEDLKDSLGSHRVESRAMQAMQAIGRDVVKPINDARIAVESSKVNLANGITEAERLIALLRHQGEEMTEAISQAAKQPKKELEQALHLLDAEQRAIFRDRELFGFYIPFAASFVIFLVSTPQAYLDILEFVSNIRGFPLRPDDPSFLQAEINRFFAVIHRVLGVR